MNFKKLKSQSGRSMVEMLGVLAIIGVLSVGGIAGYSLSMRRHRANQIVDAVSKYSLLTYNFCYQWYVSGNSDWDDITDCSNIEGMPSFDEIGKYPAGVTGISFTGIASQGDAGSVVTNVTFSDQKLCQAVASITGTGGGSSSVIPCDSQSMSLDIFIKQN